MNAPQIIHWIELSLFIPIIYLGAGTFRIMTNEIRIYWLFLIFALLCEFGFMIGNHYRVNNRFFMDLFPHLEFTVLMSLFFMWTKNNLLRKVIPLIVIFAWVFWAKLYLIDGSGYTSIADKYIRNFILIPLSFYTAYSFAINHDKELLVDEQFWILSGILVNNCINSFVDVIMPYSYDNEMLGDFNSILLFAVNIITYLLSIKGFLCLKTKMRYSGS